MVVATLHPNATEDTGDFVWFLNNVVAAAILKSLLRYKLTYN